MPWRVPLCWRMNLPHLFLPCRTLLFRYHVCRSPLPCCSSLRSRLWRISSPKRGAFPSGLTLFPSNIYPQHPRFHCAGRLWPSWSSAMPPGHLVDFWICCACCWSILPLSCVLLCFIDPIWGNRYGPGVASCQQTSDNNLGWPDPHPSP